MKKIGIDARLIGQTGVGTYTANLLEHIEKLITDTELYVFIRPEDASLFQTHSPSVHIVQADYPWHSVAEQLGFLKLLNSYNLDLMHFTYFSYPIMYNRPFVITIHDLTPLMYATGRASQQNVLSYAIKYIAYRITMLCAVYKSCSIITPTRTVKTDIISHFGSRYAGKIHVTYEGLSTAVVNATPEKPSRRSGNHTKPYFIYVGNFYPHKNLERLIDAFSEVNSDYSLILLGPNDGFFSKRIQEYIQHKGSGNIFMNLSPGNNELAYYYKNAAALIHPSLTEGFGLTLLEASQFTCPVIASDIPVFRETMGDSFISFDPESAEDIRKTIERFIRKPDKKFLSTQELHKKYSFAKMARKTYEIYRDCV